MRMQAICPTSVRRELRWRSLCRWHKVLSPLPPVPSLAFGFVHCWGWLTAGIPGDPLEIIQSVENPDDENGLGSFLPPQLKCLDKFLPSAMLKQAPDAAAVSGGVEHAPTRPPQTVSIPPASSSWQILGAVGKSPTAAQNVISELSRMQTDAPDGIHTLAFAAGVLLTCSAFMNFFTKVTPSSPAGLVVGRAQGPLSLSPPFYLHPPPLSISPRGC